MKRAGILILAFFYALAVTGISISVHYCGKRVSSVSFSTTNDNGCGCKKTKGKMRGCCHTKTISAKVNTSHTFVSQIKLPKTYATDAAVCVGPTPVQPQKVKAPVPMQYKNWHLPMGNPLYLRNRNILI